MIEPTMNAMFVFSILSQKKVCLYVTWFASFLQWLINYFGSSNSFLVKSPMYVTTKNEMCRKLRLLSLPKRINCVIQLFWEACQKHSLYPFIYNAANSRVQIYALRSIFPFTKAIWLSKGIDNPIPDVLQWMTPLESTQTSSFIITNASLCL